MKNSQKTLCSTCCSKGNISLLVAVLCVAIVTSVRATTTIYFDGAEVFEGVAITNGSPIPYWYGSHATTSGNGIEVSMGGYVVGTPEIAIVWVGDEFRFRSDWDGRGSVAQLDPSVNSYDDSNSFLMVFIANAPLVVNSFDLDLRSGGSPVEVAWTIMASNGGGLLASGTWQRATAGRDTIRSTFSGASPPWGDYFFAFRVTAGDPSFIAIDNLTIDQVPEPSATALAALGFAAVAIRRFGEKRTLPGRSKVVPEEGIEPPTKGL